MPDHSNATLRSVRDVVTALGGPSATAKQLGIGPTAVANWLTKNCIPPARFLAIQQLLKQQRKKADPTIFKVHPRVQPRARANAR